MGDKNTDFREHRITSQDGLGLYVRDYGNAASSATVVLCLAGLTRNSRDFHALALHLCGQRRVLSLDYRGRGRSDYDYDWRNYIPITYVNDVRHVLAALGVQRAFVVGTSLGGIIAMAMAAAIPTSLAGALLNDVGPEIEAAGLTKIIKYMRAEMPLRDWDAAVARLKTFFPDRPAQDEEDWLRMARGTYRKCNNGDIVYDWDDAILKPILATAGNTVNLWQLFLALGKVPLVAVRGGLSDILSEPTFRRMAKVMPGLIQVTVAGVGHAPTLSEPEVLEVLDGKLAVADRTGH